MNFCKIILWILQILKFVNFFFFINKTFGIDHILEKIQVSGAVSGTAQLASKPRNIPVFHYLVVRHKTAAFLKTQPFLLFILLFQSRSIFLTALQLGFFFQEYFHQKPCKLEILNNSCKIIEVVVDYLVINIVCQVQGYMYIFFFMTKIR